MKLFALFFLIFFLPLQAMNQHTKPLLNYNNRYPIRALAFSPDAKRIVIVNEDENIAEIRDSKTGKYLLTLKGHDKNILCVAYSPDGKFIATGTVQFPNDVDVSHSLKIWDAKTGKCFITIPGCGDIYSIAFSPDSKKIIIGTRNSLAGFDGVPKIIDISQAYFYQLPLLTHFIDGALWLMFNDAKLLNSTHSYEEIIKPYDQTHKYLLTYESDKPPFLPFLMGYDLSVNGIKKHERIRGLFVNLYGHTDLIRSVAYSRNGLFVVTGSLDTTAKIWDSSSGICLKTLQHPESVTAVDIHPNNKLVITASEDNKVRIWDVATGECIKTLKHYDLKGDLRSVRYSPDGKQILTESMHILRIWDVHKGNCLKSFATSFICPITYSLNGKYIAKGMKYELLKIWENAYYNDPKKILLNKQLKRKDFIDIKFSIKQQEKGTTHESL